MSSYSVKIHAHHSFPRGSRFSIQQIVQSGYLHIASLFTGFLIGVFIVSAQVQTPFTEKVTDRVSPRDQLSAVTPIGTPKIAAPEGGEVSGVSTEIPDAEAPLIDEISTTDIREREDELTAIIIADQDELSRVRAEMSQVRDASLALITAFELNCGSWQDPCADRYRSPLDAYNSRYSLLEENLAVIVASLSNAEDELSAIRAGEQ
jgi:hypothetical protein